MFSRWIGARKNVYEWGAPRDSGSRMVHRKGVRAFVYGCLTSGYHSVPGAFDGVCMSFTLPLGSHLMRSGNDPLGFWSGSGNMDACTVEYIRHLSCEILSTKRPHMCSVINIIYSVGAWYRIATEFGVSFTVCWILDGMTRKMFYYAEWAVNDGSFALNCTILPLIA